MRLGASSAFSSGHDPRVLHWAPCSVGSLLLPLPLPRPRVCALSLSHTLSQINKQNLEKREREMRSLGELMQLENCFKHKALGHVNT